MNIGDLRKIIADLPDDTPVVARPDLSYQLLTAPYELDVRFSHPEHLLMDGDKTIKILLITASDSCGEEESEEDNVDGDLGFEDDEEEEDEA